MSDLTLPAGTFARHWLLAAHETQKLQRRAHALIERWPKEKGKEPTDKQRRSYCNASSLGQMMELGGAAELCRLLQWRFDQAQEFKLAAVHEYLNVVLEVLQEEDEFYIEDLGFEWEKMELLEDYADPYYGILIKALQMLAETRGLELVAYCDTSGSGYVDETYWDAEMRLYQGDQHITIPFFLLSSEFGSRGSGEGDYIAENYGLPVRYSEGTQEEVDDYDRMSALESDGLDGIDIEKLEVLYPAAAASDYGTGDLSGFAENVKEEHLSRTDEDPEPDDERKKLVEAADMWVNLMPHQQERLLEVYLETHPE